VLPAAEHGEVFGTELDPERLIQLRRNRLDVLHHGHSTDYTDIDAVRSEVREARRVFVERRWPVIDVTRRSIEETAAAIMKLLARRQCADG
jgi:regulator of PEP synthase PpsR (kinase-PPPase family)